MSGRQSRFGVKQLVSCIVCVGAACAGALAHETDQYTVPIGRELADLRLYFSGLTHRMLSDVVESLNSGIERTLDDGRPTAATDHYYNPDTVARSMLLEFPPVVFFIEAYEIRLRDRWVQAEYPGLIVAHKPAFWIYHHPALVINPTKITRLKRCSTLMVDGSYLGTDKLAHFAHMGFIYFSTYRRALLQGAGEAEAVSRAVGTATGSNLFLSENALLGRMTTGVRSNADLASNYCGFKFYRNLIEPVMLKGSVRPPMLVREGVYWRLNDHVRPNSDFFAWFVSDHWDEALNPNTYGFGIATWVRAELKERCPQVLDWYRDRAGEIRSREDFFAITRELSTYYGEDYGHGGDLRKMVQVANTCFDDDQPARGVASASQTPSPPLLFDGAGSRHRASKRPRQADRDPQGRTPLWWAACEGDLQNAKTLMARGADVNAPDLDGETPLHCAVRWGYAELVDLLLQRGARTNAKTIYGITPLHLAAREYRPEIAELLLRRGTEPSAADMFGCTPLHDASAKGYERIAQSLVAAGANPGQADSAGTTPLHRAARGGHVTVAKVLVAAGADLAATNLVGHRAQDEAARGGFLELAKSLSTPDQATRPVQGAADRSTDFGLNVERRDTD